MIPILQSRPDSLILLLIEMSMIDTPQSQGNRSSILLLDGATGSELERAGVDISLPLWSARALIDAPELLQHVHQSYLQHGADAITTNTFRTHARSLAKAGIAEQAGDLTRRAVDIAQQARAEVNSDAMLFGSVAPLEDCYRPELAPDAKSCFAEHRACIQCLVEAGVDMILIETMCSAHEALAAAESARACAPHAWGISFCLHDDSTLLDGTPLDQIVPQLMDAAFIGVNCVGAPQLGAHLNVLRAALDRAAPVSYTHLTLPPTPYV